ALRRQRSGVRIPSGAPLPYKTANACSGGCPAGNYLFRGRLVADNAKRVATIMPLTVANIAYDPLRDLAAVMRSRASSSGTGTWPLLLISQKFRPDLVFFCFLFA